MHNIVQEHSALLFSCRAHFSGLRPSSFIFRERSWGKQCNKFYLWQQISALHSAIIMLRIADARHVINILSKHASNSPENFIVSVLLHNTCIYD